MLVLLSSTDRSHGRSMNSTASMKILPTFTLMVSRMRQSLFEYSKSSPDAIEGRFCGSILFTSLLTTGTI